MKLWQSVSLLLVLASTVVNTSAGGVADDFHDAIQAARARVVKVYGASVGQEKSYGSGVLVSADGQIVTTLSLLLEARSLRAVLADGRTWPARVERRDPIRQLALLKIEANDLPYFDVHAAIAPEIGDWVIAAANPFNVAVGDEPVSVSIGTLSGRTRLAGRYRSRELPYEGSILLTDVIVSAPGSAGGALVNADGALVGVIGKPAVGELTNTWVNYALPTSEIAAFLAGSAPTEVPRGSESSAQLTEAALGLHLFDMGGRVRPAYVERVQPQSPAARAGLRPNDLIVSIAGEPVQACEDVPRLLHAADRNAPFSIGVKRGDEVITLTLTPESTKP